jgi:hypothetical protein
LRNFTEVDRPLQRVYRFASIEHPMDFAPEFWFRKIIAQVDGPQKSPQRLRSPIESILLRGGSKPLQHQHRAHRSIADRGRDAQQVVPLIRRTVHVKRGIDH